MSDRFRLPMAGVAGTAIEPYGVVLLWSIDCKRKTVDAVRRLNPSVNFDFEWEKFLERRDRKAMTLKVQPLVWINFFGQPSAGVIAHEATHAIGFALEMRGALDEHKIGEEFLGYSIEKLVDTMAENIAHSSKEQR